LVLESKADMQKRGQASPDDGDALALTFAQTVAPPEKEEESATKTTNSAGIASTDPDPDRGGDDSHSMGRTNSARIDLAALIEKHHRQP
jgi:hypothetical protein